MRTTSTQHRRPHMPSHTPTQDSSPTSASAMPTPHRVPRLHSHTSQCIPHRHHKHAAPQCARASDQHPPTRPPPAQERRLPHELPREAPRVPRGERTPPPLPPPPHPTRYVTTGTTVYAETLRRRKRSLVCACARVQPPWFSFTLATPSHPTPAPARPAHHPAAARPIAPRRSPAAFASQCCRGYLFDWIAVRRSGSLATP